MRAAMARRCAAWWRRSGLRRAASKRWGCIGARSRPCSTTADWRCNRPAGPMLANGCWPMARPGPVPGAWAVRRAGSSGGGGGWGGGGGGGVVVAEGWWGGGRAGPVSGRMVDAALWKFEAILPRPTDNNDHLLLFHRMAAAHGTDGPRGSDGSDGADEPDGPDGPPRGR